MNNDKERKKSYRSIVDEYIGPVDMAPATLYAIDEGLNHPETLAMLVELELEPAGTVERHYPLPMPPGPPIIDSCDERWNKENG